MHTGSMLFSNQVVDEAHCQRYFYSNGFEFKERCVSTPTELDTLQLYLK